MANNSFSRRFPQYLSRPFQILWFEIDEVVFFVFSLTLALVFGSFMWVLFVVMQVLYARTKRNQARGFLKHVLYVVGIIQMKRYPEYFEREFHE